MPARAKEPTISAAQRPGAEEKARELMASMARGTITGAIHKRTLERRSATALASPSSCQIQVRASTTASRRGSDHKRSNHVPGEICQAASTYRYTASAAL